MPRSWTSLAESSDLYEEQAFESAAYQLMAAQVLYEFENTQRVAYALIIRYRSEFKEAFRLFGMDLVFDDAARYIAAVPDRGNRRSVLPLAETQLVLVLRKLYHEQATRGALEEGAIAIVTIDELRAAFQAATRRELPVTAREIAALIDQMQRFGIAKQVKCEDEGLQPFDVAILPGIQTLVNEATLMKLSEHYAAAASLASIKVTAKQTDSKDEDCMDAPDGAANGKES
jgi:Domain of unknown function (DUF4194)